MRSFPRGYVGLGNRTTGSKDPHPRVSTDCLSASGLGSVLREMERADCHLPLQHSQQSSAHQGSHPGITGHWLRRFSRRVTTAGTVVHCPGHAPIPRVPLPARIVRVFYFVNTPVGTSRRVRSHATTIFVIEHTIVSLWATAGPCAPRQIALYPRHIADVPLTTRSEWRLRRPGKRRACRWRRGALRSRL